LPHPEHSWPGVSSLRGLNGMHKLLAPIDGAPGTTSWSLNKQKKVFVNMTKFQLLVQ